MSATADQREADPRPDEEPAPPPAPHRIQTGEIISALSALAMIPIMFLLEWYGTVGLPRSRRSGIETAVNAWKELTIARWLILLAIIVALGSVILHATQRSHAAKTDTSMLVAMVGTLLSIVLGYRVLINLPHSSSVVDIKVGAYLGLLAALGIALGGYDSIREKRARRDKHVHRRSG